MIAKAEEISVYRDPEGFNAFASEAKKLSNETIDVVSFQQSEIDTFDRYWNRRLLDLEKGLKNLLESSGFLLNARICHDDLIRGDSKRYSKFLKNYRPAMNPDHLCLPGVPAYYRTKKFHEWITKIADVAKVIQYLHYS